MRFVCFQCSVCSTAILRGTALCTANFCRVSITIDNKRDTKVTQAHRGVARGGAKGAFAPPFFQKDKSFIYI